MSIRWPSATRCPMRPSSCAPGWYVNIPLEQTYMASWEVTPKPIRDLVAQAMKSAVVAAWHRHRDLRWAVAIGLVGLVLRITCTRQYAAPLLTGQAFGKGDGVRRTVGHAAGVLTGPPI